MVFNAKSIFLQMKTLHLGSYCSLKDEYANAAFYYNWTINASVQLKFNKPPFHC